MTKPYNTTDVQGKRVDTAVNRRQFLAIEGVTHLTPASEAAMENCLLADGEKISVPTLKQTIKENSPGYADVGETREMAMVGERETDKSRTDSDRS